MITVILCVLALALGGLFYMVIASLFSDAKTSEKLKPLIIFIVCLSLFWFIAHERRGFYGELNYIRYMLNEGWAKNLW